MRKRTETSSTTAGITAALVPLLVMALILSSCGPSRIEGRPPFARIASMALVSDKLSVDFDIRNENEVIMTIDAVEINVTAENNSLVAHRDSIRLVIGASSSERIHVEHVLSENVRSQLESVQSGETRSLAFDVEGRVHTVEDGYLEFAHKGYLYPMPGRPGEFRAAVTQAEGLSREKVN